MKQIIKKSIVFITAVAIMLTLAMPMSAEAASKKAPKLNKTKTTLTITKKKTKPAVQLKVKNAAGRKVKWASSNKKVVTVITAGLGGLSRSKSKRYPSVVTRSTSLIVCSIIAHPFLIIDNRNVFLQSV